MSFQKIRSYSGPFHQIKLSFSLPTKLSTDSWIRRKKKIRLIQLSVHIFVDKEKESLIWSHVSVDKYCVSHEKSRPVSCMATGNVHCVCTSAIHTCWWSISFLFFSGWAPTVLADASGCWYPWKWHRWLPLRLVTTRHHIVILQFIFLVLLWYGHWGVSGHILRCETKLWACSFRQCNWHGGITWCVFTVGASHNFLEQFYNFWLFFFCFFFWRHTTWCLSGGSHTLRRPCSMLQPPDHSSPAVSSYKWRRTALMWVFLLAIFFSITELSLSFFAERKRERGGGGGQVGGKISRLIFVFCCLLHMQGIFETLKRCANISKCAGGIGLAVHKIRASGSYIAGVSHNSDHFCGAVQITCLWLCHIWALNLRKREESISLFMPQSPLHFLLSHVALIFNFEWNGSHWQFNLLDNLFSLSPSLPLSLSLSLSPSLSLSLSLSLFHNGTSLQTNGLSNGLVPMLRVFNNAARYVDQGGNKVRPRLLKYLCYSLLIMFAKYTVIKLWYAFFVSLLSVHSF